MLLILFRSGGIPAPGPVFAIPNTTQLQASQPGAIQLQATQPGAQTLST